MNTSPSRTVLGRTPSEWFFSLPVFTLLLLTLIIGTGEMVHGQLLKLGESMFGDHNAQVQYFMLRADPVKPECNPNIDVDAEVARQSAGGANAGAAADDIDNLFGGEPTAVDPAVVRKSVLQAQEICRMKHDLYEKVVQHQTPQVKAYRTLETSFFGLFQFGTENRPLILLLLMGVTIVATTLGYHHISLVSPRFPRDFKIQAWTMLGASSVSMWSAIRYYQISVASGVEVEDPHIHFGWMTMFGALMLVSAWQTLRPHRPDDAHHIGDPRRVLRTPAQRVGQEVLRPGGGHRLGRPDRSGQVLPAPADGHAVWHTRLGWDDP